MPVVDWSNDMPRALRVWVAADEATWSASPTIVRGMSQRTGLRYVTMRRIATTSAVVPRSRKLAPSNTFARSALMPAGPVTWAATPTGRTTSSTLRISVTASRATTAVRVTVGGQGIMAGRADEPDDET